MTLPVDFLALVLALCGIGCGLSIAGYRMGKTLLLVSGVIILIVVLGWLAIDAFFMFACYTGGGCV